MALWGSLRAGRVLDAGYGLREIKGRAVFESMKPDARVCDVARRYGVKAQQLTTWRRLARAGRLALVTDDAADFVSLELSDPVASGKSEGPSRLRLARFRSAWMRTCRRCGSRRS
ncbi:transposase [Bradyrhizobium ottawaense]|uniref:transposase n=1 Tax=Bradyrhizobium ottawaense TaxID=931866 RepID=UPI00351476A4